MSDAARLTSAPRAVDNTDWLKTAAIIFVTVDHFGYFFMEHARWWSVFGRLAAPAFFFLLGYATTRTLPFRWIWLGVILTLLESWNDDWAWVTPNILLSLALIRVARPYVQSLLQRHGSIAFILLVSALIAVLPIAAKIVDYGAEGWLWALFGLCQRMYADDRATAEMDAGTESPAQPTHAITKNAGFMRLLACLIAVVVYVWQEQKEFSFTWMQFATFIVGAGISCAGLCLFVRGPSRAQPPEFIAVSLRFIGRHTLEIYAVQLAGSELIVKLAPQLAPS
jgi:TraX protein